MDITFSLRLPVDVHSVPYARALTRQALEHVGAPREAVEDLVLALTEACANAVQHAGSGDDGSQDGSDVGYEVQVELVGPTCRISVLDHGPGLDLDAAGAPADPLLHGGGGLLLVRDRVDSVQSVRDADGRHRVVMEKHLGRAPLPL